MGRLNYTNRKTDGLKLGQIIAKDLSKRIPPGLGSKSALRDPVVELDITGRALGNQGLLDLAGALIKALEYDGGTGKVLELEELCLKANGLDATCLPALARIVTLAAHDLRDLDLSDNHFSITSPEDAAAWELFLRSFAKCCMLRRVDLSGSPLGPKAFEVLARVYSREPGIELLSEDEIELPSPNRESRRNTIIDHPGSLSRHTRNLSVGSAGEIDTDDERGASAIDSKVTNGRWHGIRSVPYLVFPDTEMHDAGALHLSYVLSRHHHPDRMLKYVPSTKASQHLQQMDHYDNETGCQGIIYLPNSGCSGPGLKMLELSETVRSFLVDDDRPPSSPESSRAQPRTTSTSRKPSATHACSALVATGVRRRSGTRGEMEDLNENEAIKIELDRARSRVQGETLKDVGVQSNDLWRTALRMLVVCRNLTTRQREHPQSQPTPEAKPNPPPPTPDRNSSTLPKPSKPFVGYLDPLVPPLAAKGPTQPSTPKSKKPLPKLKTATPSPLSHAAASPTSASPKAGMLDIKPHRSDLAKGLPEEVWAQIMDDCLDAHRFMSERQQQAVLRWAVDRSTLAREMESLGKPESVQIWKVLEGMGCLAYESDA
ncbi:MAG: hypothetical protein Q9202_000994 [Teloschistes flavicans]